MKKIEKVLASKTLRGMMSVVLTFSMVMSSTPLYSLAAQSTTATEESTATKSTSDNTTDTVEANDLATTETTESGSGVTTATTTDEADDDTTADVVEDAGTVAVQLNLSYAYIVTQDGQTIDSRATKVDLPADKDFVFSVGAEGDYELVGVTVKTGDSDQAQQLHKADDGTYTLPANLVSDDTTVNVIAAKQGADTTDVVATEGSSTTPATEESSAAPVAEESTAEAEAEAEEQTKTTYTYEDDLVSVTAELSDANAVPDDAQLLVNWFNSTTVNSSGETLYNYDAYMERLNETAGTTFGAEDAVYTSANTLTYDIAFIKDNAEVEPSDGYVTVTINFKQNQLSESIGATSAEDVQVIHLPLTSAAKDAYSATAYATGIGADDVLVQEVGQNVSLGDPESVTITLSDFSAIAITTAGAQDDAAEEGTTGGDTTEESTVEEDAPQTMRLFGLGNKATNANNAADANNANGNTSANLSDFINGATISTSDGTELQPGADGSYTVEPDTKYTLTLHFAEDEDTQFADGQDMTYQLPSGIDYSGISGTFAINIDDNGTTKVVSGNTYYVDDSGVLHVQWNTSDPNYDVLVAAENVEFSINMSTEFSQDISDWNVGGTENLNIKLDTDSSATQSKTVWYDEANNQLVYTVYIYSKGTVLNYNFTDAFQIEGATGTLNWDSLTVTSTKHEDASGWKDSWTHDNTSFSGTIAKMINGETVTITYRVDLSDITDVTTKGKETNTFTNTDEPDKPGKTETEIDWTPKTSKSGVLNDDTITWTITYNKPAKASVAGNTVTDHIKDESQKYLTWAGDGITVKVYYADGTLKETRTVTWAELGGDAAKGNSSDWIYTIPDSDTGAYYYELVATTDVDTSSMISDTTVTNYGNGTGGDVGVGVGEGAGAEKALSNQYKENGTWYSEWTITQHIPKQGLDTAFSEDVLPAKWVGGSMYYDTLVEVGDVTGLYDNEKYEINYIDVNGNKTTDAASAVKVRIDFYKYVDGEWTTGLLPSTDGNMRDVVFTLVTSPSEDWLENATSADQKIHANQVFFYANDHVYQPSAPTTYDDLQKLALESYTTTIGDTEYLAIRYMVIFPYSGQDQITLTDTYDSRLIYLDAAQTENRATTQGDGITGYWTVSDLYNYNWTGWNWVPWSQGQTRKATVTNDEANHQLTITFNKSDLYSTVPGNPSGTYMTTYTLLRELSDAEQDAIDSSDHKAVYNNTVNGVPSTYEWQPDTINKDVAVREDNGVTYLDYTISVNPEKLTLNGGNLLMVTDDSSNLSVDPTSIKITTDPEDAASSAYYTFGEDGTIYFYVPDSAAVTITYTGQAKASGTVSNSVSWWYGGDTTTTEVKKDSSGGGTASIPGVNLMKYDGADATKKLSGATFDIYRVVDGGTDVKVGSVTTDENGTAAISKDQGVTAFGAQYYIVETKAPEGYELDTTQYFFTIVKSNDDASAANVYLTGSYINVSNKMPETGSLFIEKNVTVNGDATTGTLADGDYTFTIYSDAACTTIAKDADGAELVPVTITVKNGESNKAMVDNLEEGTYYVKETASTNDSMSVVTDNPAVVNVKVGTDAEVQTASFTNNRDYGSLQITKNVTLDGESITSDVADGTYHFNITDESGNAVKDIDGKTVGQVSITITNGAANTATVEKLAPGTYKVTEDTSKSTNKNVSLLSDGTVDVEVVGGKDASVPTATFTNGVKTGGVTIQKDVTVNGAETKGTLADGTYTFRVYTDEACTKAATDKAGNEVTLTITIENGVSSTAMASGLYAGTYYVKETGSTNTGVTMDASVKSFTIAQGETANLTADSFKNDYVDSGSLKIEKTVKVDGEDTSLTWADGTYTFGVYTDEACTEKATYATGDKKGEQVADITLTIKDGESTSTTVSDLEPGTYYVKELSGSNDKVTLVADAKDVEVTAGDVTEAVTESFENTVTTGGVKIQKDVTVNGAGTDTKLADGDYTFTVYTDEACTNVAKDKAGKEVALTITVTDGKSNTAEAAGLLAGTYYVKETAATNSAMTLDDSVKEFTVTAGETAELTGDDAFVNNRNYGSLEITKNVTVNSAETTSTDADGTYTFAITDASGNPAKDVDGKDVSTVTITIKDGKSNSATVEKLAPGTYIVKEDISKNPSGVSLVGNADGVNVTIADAAGATGKASFTNNLNKGGLTIEKAVTIDGEGTTTDRADGTYTFTVYSDADCTTRAKDTSGNDVADITLTIKDGESTSTTVENLAPSTYYVKETGSTNNDVTMDTSVKEVTVEAGNVSETAKASFTNTMATGGVKIQKDVTVNGAGTDTKLADGTYTFTVYTDEACTEVATDRYGDEVTLAVTVEGGASATAEAAGLLAGTYYVKETAGTNGEVALDTSVKSFEVKAGETADLTGDPFTNNRDTGSLEIEKAVKVEGSADATRADGTYTFAIYTDEDCTTKATNAYGNEVAEITLTITDGQSASATVSDLEAGTYYVKEIGGTNTAVTMDTDAKKVTVEAGATAAVATATATNTYKTSGTATFSVAKDLRGRDWTDDDTFEFRVTASEGAPALKGLGEDGTFTITKSDENYTRAFEGIALTDGCEYTYTIAETTKDGKGITVDTNTYTVKITGKDNGAGTIAATYAIQANDGEFVTVQNADCLVTFKNEYKASGTATFSVAKDFQGRDWTDDDTFEFSITVGENTPAIKDADGNDVTSFTITNKDENYTRAFEGIALTDGCEYTYTIAETNRDGDGIAVDTNTHEVKIAGADNGEGKIVPTYYLDGKEVSTADVTVTFKNVYSASGTATFSVAKDLQGREWTDDDTFEFQVTASEGAPVLKGLGENGTFTITKDDADFTKAFEGIALEAGKTYTYTIAETTKDGDGITVDTNTYTVKITGTDDGKGTIAATYAIKTNDGEFVTVEDAAAVVTFTNTYKAAAGTADLKVTKALTGRDWIGGNDGDSFEFTLAAVTENAPMPMPEATTATATKDAQTATFGSITYTTAGTYVYKITETVPEDTKGLTYATDPIYAKVTATDNGEGKIVTKVAYFSDEACTAGIDEPTITNTFKAATELEVEKNYYSANKGTVTLQLIKANDDFTPQKDDGIVDVIQTQVASYDGDLGTAKFSLTYDEPGTYHYVIAEVPEGDASTTFDEGWYEVTVTVGNNGAVTKTFQRVDNNEKSGTTADKATFYNNGRIRTDQDYDSSYWANGDLDNAVTVSPMAHKRLAGSIPEAGTFTFTLRALYKLGEGNTQESLMMGDRTASNDEQGDVPFDVLVFDEPGTYVFSITEDVPEDADATIIYDESTYYLKVTVTEKGDELVADTAYYSDEALKQPVTVDGTADGTPTEPTFENELEAISLQVRKVSKVDGQGLEGSTYGLWRHVEGGEDIYIASATSDADGYIVFEDVDVEYGAPYYFKEEAAPAGHLVNPYRDPYFTVVVENGSHVLYYEGTTEFDNATGMTTAS